MLETIFSEWYRIKVEVSPAAVLVWIFIASKLANFHAVSYAIKLCQINGFLLETLDKVAWEHTLLTGFEQILEHEIDSYLRIPSLNPVQVSIQWVENILWNSSLKLYFESLYSPITVRLDTIIRWSCFFCSCGIIRSWWSWWSRRCYFSRRCGCGGCCRAIARAVKRIWW